MDQKYIGYIKVTKAGKYRPALGTLHGVGEPDGDKIVNEVADFNEAFDDLEEAITELVHQCQESGINKIHRVPIHRGQTLWESQLRGEIANE